jgi:hypothetical protein
MQQRYENHRESCGQQSLDPPHEKIDRVKLALAQAGHDHRSYQLSRHDKEYVDPNIAIRDEAKLRMMQQNNQNRDCPQTINRSLVIDPHLDSLLVLILT